MAEFHDLIISVRVYDRAALHAAALKHAMTVDGLDEAGALEMLGTPTAPDEDGEDGIDLSACLQMIFDPGVSPDGCTIEESRVEYVSTDEDETEVCDECGAEVPTGGEMVADAHAESCSLHPSATET